MQGSPWPNGCREIGDGSGKRRPGQGKADKMIKMFVASSNELKDEREEMAEVVQNLNGWLYSRGEEERVALEKWEYLDSSMGVDHKQEEYNRALRDCDAAVGLCWRKFGQYTEQEVNVAREEIRAGRRVRRLEIWFKEDAEGGEISPELASFRGRLAREWRVKEKRFASMAELKALFTEMALELLEDEGIPMPDGPERKKYRLARACFPIALPAGQE